MPFHHLISNGIKEANVSVTQTFEIVCIFK